MSLILDALNKSDQERTEGDYVPGLQTRHGGESSSERAWKRFAWPVATLLFALLALMSWWYSSAPATESVAVAPAEPVSGVVEQGAALPVSVAAATDTQAADPSVAALYAGSPALANNDVSSEPALPALQQMPTAEVESQAPEPISYDIDQMADAAKQALQELPTETEQATVVEHSAPFIADLSQRTKDEIPSVFFTMHHWSSIPREREVVLNGETRREGDTIKPGLMLVEILQGSIVLDYRGTEFRLRSLNSWVNL